eukprot:CAMPEP_0172727900 /NCGR_PEP_ID=MMETSP1074-20121228/91934_1 /TAXON_ID=2916 /ORGANISM="Ceratium fusus, Strain PA161109" /LENGTH=394 /DNA_ID=CAMNT_0013555093 /DNA_START=222 /DNA_END=1405 /DNA_ORIENTATION=+
MILQCTGPHGAAELITPSHQDCAENHENCGHLGCCKDHGHKCYEKDVHWASCRSSCTPGIHHKDPEEYRTPWSCKVIRPDGGGDSGDNGGGGDWTGTLKSTHFWDCNGMACDATTLRDWGHPPRKYKAAPQYAPMNPADFGGAKYGEKLWMVGAASDALSGALGPDSDCCGASSEGAEGCGKCLLVQNPTAVKSDWTAVVMKKSRCPPDSAGCDEAHMDFAVPGFDHATYSTANVCGSNQRSNTYLSKAQSHICGSVPPKDCNCHGLPSGTPEQKMLKDGCMLFKSWGWHHGVPQLNYKSVVCPPGFVERVRVGAAFDHNGVVSLYDNSSAASALREAVLAGTDTSPRLKPFLISLPIFIIVGGGIVAGLRRRSVPQVQSLLYPTVTDSEDMGQ